MNRVFQEIGELTGSVRALHEKIDHRYSVAEKNSDLIQSEIRTIRHEVRELEQKHNAATYLLAEDVSAIKKSQDDLKAIVGELRRPVAEIVALRARAMGAFVILAPLGAAAVWLLPEPMRAALRSFTEWLRGHGS